MSRIITGEELRRDILSPVLARKPIVSELVYDKDIFLLTSDAGAGKSIFATQLAISLTFKRPFLGLDIPESKRVLYIQLEGDYEENVERMKYMEQEGGIIIDEKNLLWAEEKTLEVLDPASVSGFLARIDKTGFKPEVVIIDPIYKLSGQDISSGVAALGVIRFSDKLQNKWSCANILIHHNLKDSYAQDGKKVNKDDSYYGHSFIKNHIRTSYAMRVTGEYTRSLIRKKGRGSDTRRQLELDYNPETYCLSISEHEKPHKRGKHYERFYTFLESKQKANQSTHAKEIIEECEITYDQLRTLKARPETVAIFTIQKQGINNKEVWIPKLP